MLVRWIVTVAVLLMLGWSSALCSVAVGLQADSGIFVQEYQLCGGELKYCIHNARAESVALVLREVWFDDSAERRGEMIVKVSPGRRVTGDTLAVVVLGPGEFARLPTVEAPEPRLVEYVANGTPIGLVANHDAAELSCNRAVLMPTSLNGPGWHRDGMWTEQDSLWVQSGEEFTVDLVLEQGAGEIRIYRQPARGMSAERFLAPYDIVCGEMVIAKEPEEFVVRASAPSVEPGLHRATLKFRAPGVDSASLFTFGGFRWLKYGATGWPISRGVFVRPGD